MLMLDRAKERVVRLDVGLAVERVEEGRDGDGIRYHVAVQRVVGWC